MDEPHGAPGGVVRMPIDHVLCQSLTQFVMRRNVSTEVEAGRIREQRPVLLPRTVWCQLLVRPLGLFWKSYVRQAGWRDGMRGLVVAALDAWVYFLTWAKAWAQGLPPAPAEGPVEAPGDGWGPHRGAVEAARERLSVVVLTKNEEARIAGCLRRVRWADELLVVDGMSTDRTAELAQTLGARVIRHAFDGSFASDRNLALEQARGDWVLFIDADDVVTPGFREAAQRMLSSQSPHAVFMFRRRSVLLGRVMRYGGWHYHVPNFVRRTQVRFEGLVHERPRFQGTIGRLDADIEHHPCEDLAAFVDRQNRYTSLQAEELAQSGPRLSERDIRWRLWRRPWKIFWKSYVKKGGFREGLHGLVFAEFFAGVELLKWAKYWELAWAGGSSLKAEGPSPQPGAWSPEPGA